MSLSEIFSTIAGILTKPRPKKRTPEEGGDPDAVSAPAAAIRADENKKKKKKAMDEADDISVPPADNYVPKFTYENKYK